MQKYICAKCNGPVVPGQNGFIRGVSLSPDGDPRYRIKEFDVAIHYPEDCGNPNEKVPWPKLKELD